MQLSMYEQVQKRIKQLKRDGWEWVKHSPRAPYSMCALVDARQNTFHNGYAFDEQTIEAMNVWIRRWSGGKWCTMFDYNDMPDGAESVDDVIEVLEKFAAEL